MTIAVHCCLATLRGLAVPLLVLLVACGVILQAVPHDPALGPDHSSGHWLHLPGLVLSAAALAATLEHWPLLSRDRPGAGWLQRCTGRELHGCGAAMLGGLVALGIALATTGAVFALLLEGLGHDPGPVRAPVRFATEAATGLTPQHPAIEFRSADAAPVQRVRLRPTAYFGAGSRAAGLRVTADGQALHEGWIESLGEPLDLPVEPARSVAILRVERRPEPGLVLSLPAAAVEAEPVATRSRLLNGLLAGLSYLLPAALAFAVLVLGRADLALPVNLAAGLATVVLCTVTGWTPNAASIEAFARARFVAGGGVADSGAAGWLPPLGACAALMVAAALIGRSRGSA